MPLEVRIVGHPIAVLGHGIPVFRVTRGSIFHFRVALTNTGKHPYRFPNCPVYEEAISHGPHTRSFEYVLNCRAVGTLASEETAYFEMRLPIYHNAELGRSSFAWILSSSSYDGPKSHAKLEVVP